MYYFIKSYTEGGKRVFYPVSGQKGISRQPVTADRDKRDAYPLGTVFGTTELAEFGGVYYATDIYPMDTVDLLPGDLENPAPEEMVAAWEMLRSTLPEDGETDSVRKPRRKKKTIIEELLDKCPYPSIEKDGFWVDPTNWEVLLCNIHTKANTLLVGPAGTGKTELAMFIGKCLGLDVKVYDMGSMHDPMTQLLGTHRLEKDGEATRSTFDYASFVEDIQKPGIIVLDELSRAPLMTNNILFPCLDSRRELPVEMAGEHDRRRIKVHDECVFIATANIGAEYTGTMSLDKALVSRFFPVELDFMPEEKESGLLGKRTSISTANADMIVRKATKLRKMYREGELSAEVSVRDTLRCAQQVSFGRSVASALQATLLPMFAYDERDQVKRVFMTA